MAEVEKKVRKALAKKANKTLHASPDTGGKAVVCNVKDGNKKA